MSISAEGGRQFVDTNVLLYAYSRVPEDKHRRAVDLVRRLWDEGAGALSVQVLQEFFVNATTKIAGPLEESIARRRVRQLGTWTTHAPDPNDVLEAIDIRRDYGISFWDAMIVRSAASLRCGVLWTEDLNHGQVYRGVRVANPFRE